MPCKLTLEALAQQILWRQYTGAASTDVGANYNYSYTLSDTVDQSHLWAVLYASVVIVGGSGSPENNVGLWLLQPGAIPAGNNQAYHADPFFGANPATSANGPPILNGAIRVDEQGTFSGGEEQPLSAELVMVRRSTKLIVPPGCTLMAWSGGNGFGIGGSLSEQFLLKIGFVPIPLTNTDEVEW